MTNLKKLSNNYGRDKVTESGAIQDSGNEGIDTISRRKQKSLQENVSYFLIPSIGLHQTGTKSTMSVKFGIPNLVLKGAWISLCRPCSNASMMDAIEKL